MFLNSVTFYPQLKTHSRTPLPLFKSFKPTISTPQKLLTNPPNLLKIRSVHGNSEPSPVTGAKPRWENALSTAASLYPVYVTVGGAIACLRPSTFSWFVERGPASYTLSLGFIMLSMGITLELRDLVNLFMQRPLAVSF